MTLTSCEQHSKSEKKAATEKIEKYLEEKYDKKFTVNTAEDLFIHIPGELFSDVVGFEAEAYPIDAPENIFRVEYWEEKNRIEDEYINYIMIEKLKDEVYAQVSPLLGRNIKIDAWYDNGPWGNMPDNKYTPSTAIKDYDYIALIDVYVEQTKTIDKIAEANNIDKIQRILLKQGLERLSVTFFYMSPEEFERIEKIKKEDEEDNLYRICRASPSCITSTGRVEEGKVKYDFKHILESFDFARDIRYKLTD